MRTPRILQKADQELLALTSVCEMLMGLPLEARKRVMGYVVLRYEAWPEPGPKLEEADEATTDAPPETALLFHRDRGNEAAT